MTDERIPDLVQRPYEPPRVEEILTPAQLEREVQYAGAGTDLPKTALYPSRRAYLALARRRNKDPWAG
jgi:hypothetical protein